MKQGLAKALLGLWAALAAGGVLVAPAGAWLYPRLGGAWLLAAAPIVGALLALGFARPAAWALRAIARPPAPALPAAAPGAAKAQAPAPAAASAPWWLRALGHRVARIGLAAVGAVGFATLGYGVALIVNGHGLVGPGERLDCKVTGARSVDDGARVEASFDCALAGGTLVASGAATLVAGDARSATIGHRFALVARRGRLGVWVLESRGAGVEALRANVP
ncbi:MAG: hypothetical protein IT376_10585 [Polyangiaceae bacterium]|nr:hypothetical protein [Polyangiaceae bacterium]